MKVVLVLLFVLTLCANALEIEILSTTMYKYNEIRLDVLVTNRKSQSVSLLTCGLGLSYLDFDIIHDKQLEILHHDRNDFSVMKSELKPGEQFHTNLYYMILRAKPGTYQLSLHLRNNEKLCKKTPFRIRIDHSIEPEILEGGKRYTPIRLKH